MELSKLTTGNKDVDWKIFNELSDRDILNLCLVNKEMSQLCENEAFWEWRLKQRNNKKATWKEMYKQNREFKTAPKWVYVKNINPKIPNLIVSLSKLKKDNKNLQTVNVGDLIDVKDYEEDPTSWRFIVTEVKPQNKYNLEPIQFDDKINSQNMEPGVFFFPESISSFVKNIGLDYYWNLFKTHMAYDHVSNVQVQLGDQRFVVHKSGKIDKK